LLVGLLGFAQALHTQRQAPPTWDQRPRLLVDLRDLGYRPWVVKKWPSDAEAFRRLDPAVDPSTHENYHPRAVFADAKTIALYFTRGVYREADGEAHFAIPSSVRFHLYLIDSTSGALLAAKEWPTVFRRGLNAYYDTQSTAVPVANGRFLVHANDRLELLDTSLHLLSERNLEVTEGLTDAGGVVVVPGGRTRGWSEMWAAFSSPGGRTVAMQHLKQGAYKLEWLDAADLAPIRRMELPVVGITAASDRAVLYQWHDGRIPSHTVNILLPGEAPRVVCEGDFCASSHNNLFLEKDQVLVCGRSGFDVRSAVGEVLWSPNTGKDGSGPMAFGRSLEGNRFFVVISSKRRKSLGDVKLSRGENIVVYDVPTHRAVFTLGAKNPDLSFIGSPALSPDGSMLAIVFEPYVALYDLEKPGP